MKTSIVESWKSIEAGLTRFENEYFKLGQFNPPATTSAIGDFQNEFEMSFPKSLVESLLIHDGETPNYNAIFGWQFCSLDLMSISIKRQREIAGLRQREEPYIESSPSGWVRSDIDWSIGWLPIMFEEESGLFIDFDPGDRGTHGQIVQGPWLPCGYERRVVAKNYEALLARIAEVASALNTTPSEYDVIDLDTRLNTIVVS